MTQQKFTFKNAPTQLGSATKASMTQVWIGATWIAMAACFISGALLPNEDWSLLFLLLICIGFLLFLGIMLFHWTPLGNRQSPLFYGKQAFKHFAAKNGLSFFGRRKEQYDPLFYPALAQLGIRGKEEYGCEGDVGGVPVVIYVHSYRKLITQDAGRTWTLVYKVTLPRVMPHTFLQSRNEVAGRTITAVARTFDDNQRVSLQNNLDKYFLFYTHRRTVTDGLALWSPQLLYDLRKLGCSLSVETIGNTAYFYVNNGPDETVNMKKDLEFIEKTIQSFRRSLRVEFLKLPNEAKYPFLRSRPTGGVYAIGGKYINYGWVVLGGYALYHLIRISIIYPVGSAAYWEQVAILGGIGLVISIVLLAWRSGYTRTKHRRGM